MTTQARAETRGCRANMAKTQPAHMSGRPRGQAERDAAARWLADLLADGPLLATDVRQAARRAGWSDSYLRGARKALGVVKDPPTTRVAYLLLPGQRRPSPGGQRECSACGALKALDDFAVNRRSRGGRAGVCRLCDNARKRRSEARARDPEHPDHIAQRITEAPDPTPAATLRLELVRQRAKGRSFPVAWRIATNVALRGLPPQEGASWRSVFSSTRYAWEASYERSGQTVLAELTAAA